MENNVSNIFCLKKYYILYDLCVAYLTMKLYVMANDKLIITNHEFQFCILNRTKDS